VHQWQKNLYSAWTAQLLAIAGFSFVFPFMPLYVQELGVRGVSSAALWSGALTASTALTMAVAAPIWGNLADRFGRKVMVMRAMAAGCLIVGAMGLVVSVQQLLVLRILQGVFTGTVSASTAMVSAGTPKDRQGFALGLMTNAVFLGAAGGPVLGGVVARALGFRAAFLVAGASLGLGALVVAIFVKESFVRSPPATHAPGRWNRLSHAFPLRGMAILLTVYLVLEAAGLITGPILALYVGQLSHSSRADTALISGVIFGASALASAIASVALGRQADRRSPQRLLVICAAGSALSYLPQAFVTSALQLGVLRVLSGAFLGGVLPAANSMLARRTPPERRGAAYGMTASAQALGTALGPLSGAVLAARFGIPAVFLWAAVALGMVSVLASWGALREGRQVAPPAGAPASARVEDAR
jgi:DHA1 family multidrug resistance protein-like MFS transporter